MLTARQCILFLRFPWTFFLNYKVPKDYFKKSQLFLKKSTHGEQNHLKSLRMKLCWSIFKKRALPRAFFFTTKMCIFFVKKTSAILLQKILLHKNVTGWISTIGAIGITLASPQLLRIHHGHYALAYSFIPILFIYLKYIIEILFGADGSAKKKEVF